MASHGIIKTFVTVNQRNKQDREPYVPMCCMLQSKESLQHNIDLYPQPMSTINESLFSMMPKDGKQYIWQDTGHPQFGCIKIKWTCGLGRSGWS